MLYTIPLPLARKFEALAKLRGVSKVARGEQTSSQTPHGFFEMAKRAHGNIALLKTWYVNDRFTQTWWDRRNAFCERHVAQQSVQGTPLVESRGKYKGTPTRRQLGLIMWMGSSLSPSQLRTMLPRVKQIVNA